MPKSRWTKVLFSCCASSPLGRLGGAPGTSDLTANPIEYITHFTGDWTIRLIVITLAVTPLAQTPAPAQPDPLSAA